MFLLVGIGMAGCYDIAKHYQFEMDRGVEYLSSMTRAIGGPHKYTSQSPSVILAHCSEQLGRSPVTIQQGTSSQACIHTMATGDVQHFTPVKSLQQMIALYQCMQGLQADPETAARIERDWPGWHCWRQCTQLGWLA